MTRHKPPHPTGHLRQPAAEQLPLQVPPRQAAEFFGVDVRTVRRWISDGRLTAHRVGPRLIRIDRESILRLANPIGGAARA
ncbi:MAG: excisionase family DNA-binding protein [Mycobacterium sp.]|uniref:excisionase family DNA-binding protein n=1 Tax=Mycobacterium sp. TaxID=1785 RepID=UPI003F992474